jgi:hypothetical protein
MLETARVNATVGSILLAVVIPKRAVIRDPETGPAFGLAADPIADTVTWGYYEGSATRVVEYGPTFTCNGYALTDVEVEGNDADQSIQMRILRLPVNPGPNQTVGVAVRATGRRGYVLELHGTSVQLKKVEINGEESTDAG